MNLSDTVFTFAYVYGEYSEVVEATTLLKKMDKPSIGGRTSTALRLNWNKYNDADGYIIEKYDGAKWTRVKKLTNNQTTTYRIEGLKPSTKYQFRIRAYTISGAKAVYGEYSNAVTGYTNPSVVSGLKIGGRAVSALRLGRQYGQIPHGHRLLLCHSAGYRAIFHKNKEAHG